MPWHPVPTGHVTNGPVPAGQLDQQDMQSYTRDVFVSCVLINGVGEC